MGRLDQAFHVFRYLKRNKKAFLVFDDSYVNWDESGFQKKDWSEFYCDAKENIPPNALQPRSHSLQMNVFVDVDHAGNHITRQSHTGILIFLNKSLITWYSEAQNMVETSTFGSEFVAM